jgi:hypothetical protein
LLKHGQRPISAMLVRRIKDINPQGVVATVEVFPRKYALVCMETNSN